MDAKEARTIGWRLRRIRNDRNKSLRVIAGLAGGMSSSTLHRIEHGKRPVTLTELVALANALEIAPSELTRLPLPAPANGHTDSTTEAVRLALDAIDIDRPDGLALPVAVLRDQVAQLHTQLRACQFAEVATELPALIRNLHTTATTGGLVGLVTACHAMAAVLDRRYGDRTAPMDAAAEVAERFGATNEADSLGFLFGPVNAGCFRMWLALEAGEPDHVVRISQEIDPERHPFRSNRAIYWVHSGRALAQLRGRHDDAVRALRTAEDLHPTLVRRHPMARDTIATLLPGARRDTIGTELRRMAHRAGLPT